MALTPAATAEVVYTPADITFTHGMLEIDLNHDGITDFKVHNYATGYSSFYTVRLTVSEGSPEASAEVIGRKVAIQGSAWAAPFTFPIGEDSPKPFISPSPPALMALEGCEIGYCFPIGGPWRNATRRYLGLRFSINGEVHYGWARFSVQHGYFFIGAKLSGYAYETEPNKTILAGDRGLGLDASSEG